jgi:activator of 2-hydroxyglutaryl-CoA dehydratase
VISLLTSGIAVEDIARAIHEALLNKLVALLAKVMRSDSGEILFVGGGAKNRALVQLLAEALNRPVTVPEHPDFYGAYGAAISAKKMFPKENM